MDEYIKKEEAIRALLNDAPEQVGYSREDAADCIRYMDAADVAPVRHAKVIDKISDDHEIIKPWDYRYYCSACKIPMRESWFKYCPNCGAIMDLEG